MINEVSSSRSLQESLGHELLKVALILLFIVVPIRFFIAQPFIVSGSSMEPTFENGDYLIVDQLSFEIGNPDRYDVVVFKYPFNKRKYFIKRIIGLPGERVVVANGAVTVFNEANPEGIPVYAPPETQTVGSLDLTLAETQYFVLGDNRSASSDSRVWGALERDLIVGTPLLRLLPTNEAGISPGTLDEGE